MDPIPLPPDKSNTSDVNVKVPPKRFFDPDFKPNLESEAKPQNGIQPYKLAASELQGPKPPLVGGSGSKFALMAIGLILIVIAGIGGYYFYTKDNNLQPLNNGDVIIPTTTPVADKNLDSDKDGLPDAIEKVLGTNLYKADTDGDGYSDLQEIKNGYSPLIAGAAGKYTPEQWQEVKDKIKAVDGKFYESVFGVESNTFQIGQNQSYCKIPKGYGETYQQIFGIDVKTNVDFKIYAPTYIPSQIKQLCPIESEKVQKGYRVVNINFYLKNTDIKNIQDYSQLPSRVLVITENNSKETETLTQQKETFKGIWNSEDIKIKNYDALLLEYKSEALKSNSVLQMKLKSDPSIANTKVIKLFIGDTFIDIHTEILSKEDLIKLAESLTVAY